MINVSLKNFPNGQINTNQQVSFVEIMAWRQTGDTL